MQNKSISTYVINLPERLDRKKNIIKEFNGKPEFEVKFVDAIKDKVGSIGLWKSIKIILTDQLLMDDDYIIICEDDHEFTNNYSKDLMFKCILDAQELGADIMLGGVSSVGSIVKSKNTLIWIEKFTGLQFTIIFRKFFSHILNANFSITEDADIKISTLTKNKFLIFPYISIQREFGYSDVTTRNNEFGVVSNMFLESSSAIKYLLEGDRYYKSIVNDCINDTDINNYDFAISTFIINLAERTDRLSHIKSEFEDKHEFDISIVNAVKHEIGAVGLWLSIRNIIKNAILTDEDVILICEDDHKFTEYYNKKIFIRNIIRAHNLGADILSGGVNDGFSFTSMITDNIFWLNHFYGTQFIVIYKKIFQKILSAEFDLLVTADDFLSSLTSNKMVLYPFISQQKYFGYSDVSPNKFNAINDTEIEGFSIASSRLQLVTHATNKFRFL